MFKVFKNSGIESAYSVSANSLFSSDGWTIYPAKHKATKRQCSVWIFDKKKFESVLLKLGVLTKSNKHSVMEECFQVLRNYVSSLVKLKHPSILQVYEPLEDHKSRALFVTEYVVNNLQKIDKQELDEIMITKGLLQVSQGVKFIHETLQSVHLNIQPSTVFINENFDWKLSGLNFLQHLETGSGELNTFDPRMPTFVNVNFKFSSPNLILNRELQYADDLFSLGALIYYLFNSKNVNSSTPFILNCENNNISEYQRDVKRLQSVLQSGNMSPFRNIPENYLQTLIVLLNFQNNSWSINQFIESNIFNNELIKILNFFDSFVSQDQQEQHRFLNKFKNYSLQFPKQLLLNKFLPILCDLLETFTKDSKKQVTTEEEALVYAIWENVFIICQNLSQLSFIEKVLPKLQATVNHQSLITSKILIINNLNLVESKLGVTAENASSKHHEIFSKLLMTLFKIGIAPSGEAQALLFQERILSNLSTFIQFQSYNLISSSIFPDICALFTKTTSLKIKNLTIDAFIVLLTDKENSLDTFIITEKLLPILHNTSTKNFKNAEFLKKLVSLYDAIFAKLILKKQDLSHLDVILEQVFFELWKLLKFSKTQQFYRFITQVIDKIEKFLIQKYSENLTIVESELSPTPSSSIAMNSADLNGSSRSQADFVEDGDDDGFGEFSSGSITKQTARLQLKPTPGVRPAAGSTLTPSNKGNNSLSFGATSAPVSMATNTNTINWSVKSTAQSTAPATTHSSASTSTSTINWSARPAPQATAPVFSQSPMAAQSNASSINWPMGSQNAASLPPGFSMGSVIQPTKKPATPTPTSPPQQQHQINWSANNGDSLI